MMTGITGRQNGAYRIKTTLKNIGSTKKQTDKKIDRQTDR